MLIHFYHPEALLWLWLVPAAAGLFSYAAVKRRKALQVFGSGGSGVLSRKREAFGSCTAILLVVLSLARPAWNLQEHTVQESGRDVIFLLDVSRSMLAEDLHPNRLEHAKIAILDCVHELETDRVALVLFAGSAEIRCPLTVDYEYFRMALRQASPDSVGAGGTMLAHAIERTVEKLVEPARAGMQDLILITDGEDQVEGDDELTAAGVLADAGVRLIAIGLGSKLEGSRIPLEDETAGTASFMKHGDTEVRTRLQAETLRRMTAGVPGGLYFDVATGSLNLRQIYQQVMEYAERTTTDARKVERYQEKFHLFLIAAVLVLLLSHRWPRSRTTIALLSLLLAGGTVQAGPSRLFSAGNNAYAEGRFEDAVTLYTEAAAAAPDDAAIHYNLGTALYRSGDFNAAAASFELAASLAETDELISRCWYNLGNCLVKTGEALRADDPEAAAAYCRQAGWHYRRALNSADAAYNLEIALRIAAEIEQDIERRKEEERQQNELVLYLREKLEQFIRRQTALIEDGIAGEPQEALRQDTLALADVMEKSGLHASMLLPDGTEMPGPLQETFEHTMAAAEAMAIPDQPTALSELTAALQAAPTDPSQRDRSEDEDSETADDYDMENRTSEDESDQYELADPFGDFSDYEEIRGVPPPNKTEMDILAEEIRNQEQRKKKAGEYTDVEKDW